MRRPILLPVFAMLFGMSLVAILGKNFNGIFWCLFLGVMTPVVLFLTKRTILLEKFAVWKNRIICLVIFFVLGAGIFYNGLNHEYFLNEFHGRTVTLNGNVIFAEKKDKDVYYLTLLVREGQGVILKTPERALIRIYGSLDNFQNLVGKELQLSGKLEAPSPARNPKCFDYEKYLKTKRIGSIVNVNPRFIEETGWGTGISSMGWRFLNKVSLVKWDFINALSQKIPSEQMALVKGMLFGDKSDIDSDVLLQFQRNSTAHILAVSGLHVGMIYALLVAIFRKKNSFIFDALILSLLSVYAIMSFLAPSVVRAVFMIGLHIIAKRFHFKYDLLSATSFSGGVVLLINPMMLLNVGFQLSYIALLSISFLMPFFRTHISLPFFTPFFSLIAVQIGMIPIIAFHFNNLSFIGVIANIPTIILSGLIIPLLIIMFPLHLFLSGILMNSVATAAGWLIQALVYMNESFYFDGKFSTLVASPPFWTILFFYTSTLFMTSELALIWIERKFFVKFMASIALIILISILSGIYEADEFKDKNIVFLDVGQGDCLFIETPTGKTVMIDSGGSTGYDVGRKTLLPYLLKNGHRKLDLAVVTHLHQDHYGGFKTLSQEIPIGGLVLYEGYGDQKEEIVSETGFGMNQLIFARKGDSIRLDEFVSIEILYPKAWDNESTYCPEDENQMSLVMMVVYDGMKILMTGDIDQKGENHVIGALENIQDLNCHILKVPHHGSKHSMGSSFIKFTKPDIAVIQVGKNNFGHPSSTVLEKCHEKDIIVFRNDLHGAIGVQGENWNGNNIWVKTMITNELK